MTIAEAALYLGVPVPTLHSWVWTGYGPPHEGTRWRPWFEPRALDEWLAGAKSRVNRGFDGWASDRATGSAGKLL